MLDSQSLDGNRRPDNTLPRAANDSPSLAGADAGLSAQAVVAMRPALAGRSASQIVRQWWPQLVFLGALATLFAPVIVEAAHLWLTDEYSGHGLFIPIMAGLIVWWKRDELARLPVAPSAWGWAFLLPGIALEMVAWHAQIRMIAMLSLVPVLIGATLLCFGKPIFRALCFPLLFLLFMAPLPRYVVLPTAFPIQVISTSSACTISQGIGIPLIRDGFNVNLQGVTVEVAESCSGFKNVLTLVVFGTFYAALFSIPLWRQVLLVGLTIPVAICANVLRVLSLILAAQWGGETWLHHLHDASGLIVLGLSFAMLAGLGKLLGCKKMRYQV